MDRQQNRKDEKMTNLIAWGLILGFLLPIFGIGWHCGIRYVRTHKIEIIADNYTQITVPDNAPSYCVRRDIVSDGNELYPELQVAMQNHCTEYGVPYALVLAVAEQESNFAVDCVSCTNDYGIMQINECNHGWLRELGIEPMTRDGNIKAGVLILSQKIEKYGDIELALMAYNCGDAGAKRLWDRGIYSTDYSKSVMNLYRKWQNVICANG